MPTPNERRALVFLSAVAFVGGAVRLHATLSAPVPPPAAREALDRQIAAVDSAKAHGRGKGHGGGKRAKGTSAAQRVVGSLVVVQPDSGGHRVDVDVAPASEIERLPRIGPALARRIVADRDSFGPYGSIDELQKVKGVGPGMARAISPYVTFSLSPRPSDGTDGATGRPQKSQGQQHDRHPKQQSRTGQPARAAP